MTTHGENGLKTNKAIKNRLFKKMPISITTNPLKGLQEMCTILASSSTVYQKRGDPNKNRAFKRSSRYWWFYFCHIQNWNVVSAVSTRIWQCWYSDSFWWGLLRRLKSLQWCCWAPSISVRKVSFKYTTRSSILCWNCMTRRIIWPDHTARLGALQEASMSATCAQQSWSRTTTYGLIYNKMTLRMTWVECL